jgi:hypothetical protein
MQGIHIAFAICSQRESVFVSSCFRDEKHGWFIVPCTMAKINDSMCMLGPKNSIANIAFEQYNHALQ